MASKELITKVWIEDGCIVCDACETAAPDVFEVLEETCIIRPAAMAVEFTKPRTEDITDAAEECPVDVIKFETVTEDVAGGAEPAAPDAAESEPAVATPKQSPEKAAPAVASTAQPATVSASTPDADSAPDPDAAIAGLLRAATSRGGHAGILREQESVPQEVQSIKRKSARDLPPDARQARVIEAARKSKKDPDVGRRGFVGSSALGIGWAAFGIGTGVSAGPALYRFMMPNVLEEPDPRVRVGKIQRYMEMQPGDVNEDYKQQGIWMVRDRDRLVALNIICTHLGCIPNWLPNDRKFKCPCHGSGYLPNGINFEGPTPRPLERFKISIEDGIVIVDKSKKFQHELGQWDQTGSFLEV